MNKSDPDRIAFLKRRDAHQRGGVEYRCYTDRIGDSDYLYHLFPNVLFDAHEKFPPNFRILDLCCGPGMAGMSVDRELRKYGYDVSKVIFVDAEKTRLVEIPTNPRYAVVHDDVLSFLDIFRKEPDNKKADIVILRNAFYYFTENERDRLLSGIQGSLRQPGCFLFSSYGFTPDTAKVLTQLHERIFQYVFSTISEYKGRGVYDEDVVELCERMTKYGLSGPILEIADLTFTTHLLADKYRLNEEAKRNIEEFLLSQPPELIRGVNIRRIESGVAFDVDTYTYEFVNFCSHDPKQQSTGRRAYVNVPVLGRNQLLDVLDRFLISRASQLTLFFDSPSHGTPLSEVVDHYAGLCEIQHERKRQAVISRRLV